MSPGVSVRVTGVDEAVAHLEALPAVADSVGGRMLLEGANQAHSKLKDLLNMPKRRDPFWGVTGTDSPVGLARRSGVTEGGLIFPRLVFRDASGTLSTYVAHGAEHVRQLEEGGPVPGTKWIPTAAAQTPGGAEITNIPGAFVWPTARMKTFANGRPKHEWLVISAKKFDGSQRGARSTRSTLRRAGILPQGPLPNTPGGLVFLKMKVDSVTTRGHHTFGTARQAMEPVMDALGQAAGAQIARSA